MTASRSPDRNLGGLARRWVGTERIAYVDLTAAGAGPPAEVRFDAFDDLSARVAGGLLARGLNAGDRIGMTVRRIEHLTLGAVMLIGVAQVLALIPGTSRSGITMTAARFCGLERTDAARFSMLLAMPAILGAATLAGWDLYQLGDLRLGLDAALAAALAFAAALLAIAVLMNWLSHATFTPFVVYRIALGGVLFYLIYEDQVRGLFGA